MKLKKNIKRTIKFRGKRLKTDDPLERWIEGSLVEYTDIYDHKQLRIVSSSGHYNDVSPETVGQFTGQLDKNGKEIYEGDIITVKGLFPRVVLWDKMMWALMPTEYYHDEVFWVMNLQHPGVDWWEEFADEFEIIGNIHDNPSLISDKK